MLSNICIVEDFVLFLHFVLPAMEIATRQKCLGIFSGLGQREINASTSFKLNLIFASRI